MSALAASSPQNENQRVPFPPLFGLGPRLRSVWTGLAVHTTGGEPFSQREGASS